MPALAAFLRRSALLPAGLDDATWARLVRVRMGIYEALHRYRPSPLPIPVTLFHAPVEPGRHPTLGWGDLVGACLCTVPITGEHETLLNPPHVDRLADLVNDAMPSAERGAAE